MSLLQTNPIHVQQALQAIGRDEALREQFISFLKNAEKQLSVPGISARETITGPLLDTAMEGIVFRKKISNGLEFELSYIAKISRDFLLSPDSVPDHVWEPQTTKLLRLLAASAKQILIGGAYIGDQAIILAHESRATIHCFEPNAATFQRLKKNQEINRLGNMVLNNLALWHRSDVRIKLVGEDSHAFPQEVSHTEGENSIPVVSINDYCKRNAIGQLDVIMLDLEGGEQNALLGAVHFLKQDSAMAPHLVFEVHRHYVNWSGGLNETEIIQFIRQFGYTIWAVRDFQSNYPMQGKPIELIDLADVYLEGPPHGFNLFATKRPGIVQNENFNVVKNVSPKLLLHKDPKLHHPLYGL